MTAAVRTTCPYCGVGCGLVASARRATASYDDPRRSRASRELRPRVLEGCGARRDAGARRPAAASRDPRRARELGRGARRRRRAGSRDTIAAHGPDSVAFYVSGQLLDRGLLRREQADEGLHRQREHRHELAAVHGVRRRGLQARVRRGHGAERLHGPRAGGPRRARRLESRVVPSGAVPAHRRRRRAANPQLRVVRDRPAAHGRPATSPICSCSCAPAPTYCCSTGC